ncbi:Glycosyl hydrolases family 2, TIM barrel domain [Prevotella sp. khp7]|uniref:sugar-binding domain-containing protein n=1 Tax=Prevotella sp. khp7 TaxID=1761885 RepID=UPI0008BAC624|nr:sugar-binding domain-containing protein [Prevotella sp. khp7]SEW24692.1 Glycosyl hydrolases family 2, TIM barrel domain [Prevotella sp. khp7]
MKRLLLLVITFHISLFSFAQETVNLAGSWQLAIGDTAKYTDDVVLPGSMLTNGKGNPVTVNTPWTGSLYDSSYYYNPFMEQYRRQENIKFPFFLTPEKHYVGKAWYRKSVYVPDSWKKKYVTLYLERPHIETTVYVNSQKVGSNNSLSAPHQFDVTPYIKIGERNTIEICVYNGIDGVGVGQDSHSVTDQTQGNWNGIVGKMELRAQPARLHIDHVTIRPKPYARNVQLDVKLSGQSPNLQFYQMEVLIQQENKDSANVYVSNYDVYSNVMQVTVPIPEKVDLWDEFHPNLYRMAISVGDDYYETTFGMREVSVEGRQIILNRRPIFLRGTVENCCFPETGYPPTDEESWLRIFRKCKEYGLNHMRFHSYCPPEAAFVAADKLGFYLQPEGPSWPNHGVKLLSGQIIDQYLLLESKRMIDAYGHHPSFIMMAAGNEPAGNWVEYCNNWVKEMKRYDPTRIYCGASVGGGWAWDDGSEYHVKGGARGLDWVNHAPSSDDDYYSQILRPRNYKDTADNNSPIIAHEQGQWCAFPDFKEIPQYTGAYKAKNFEIFRDLLAENGMELQAEKFLMASGKLQTLCYKYEIERNLRTSDYAGFQLLALNDYSGQGTALEGVLGVHWNEKGYTNAKEWHQFCSPIVPLARFPKFVYTTADSLVVPVEVYNAMYGDIRGVRVNYYINSDSGKVYHGGLLYSGEIPLAKHTPVGLVRFPLDGVRTPQKLTLTVTVGGNLYKNSWNFWVYPDSVSSASPSDILITDSLDAAAIAALKQGGKVLLTSAGKVRLGSDVVQHYLPVFWNTSWFKMRPPHTTGAYIDQTHPLFKYGFPTDSWSNLNWWELLNKAQVMNLQDFPKDYQSPIQPIDTWHVSRKLGMVVEANVLKGKLLMTTMDISSDLEHRVVARQMREAILSYMDSSDFAPSLTLNPDIIQNLYTKEGPKVTMFTKDSPDELKPKLK